ncbi:MAG: hypothetical protein JSV33_05815 [bacterium]|nr:MAG: hypothetical protein JSV33_05815 [bacterium]
MCTFRLLSGVVLLVVLTFLVAPTVEAGEELSRDEYTILRICEGVVRLFERKAEAIWPGYSLAEQSFLVYVPERWALLFNSDTAVNGFETCPRDWPDLDANVLYHEGTYGELVGQLVFDLSLGEITTVALGIPEDFSKRIENPEVEAFAYIVHEAFHQYQRGAFGEVPWAREEKYPVSDLNNAALAWLEMRILQDALEAAVSNDPKQCRRSVEEFVAVRYNRWDRCDPFVGEYEQGKELNEGTAKYVELRCVEFMPGVDYVSSLDGATSPLAGLFTHAAMPELLLRELRERMGEGCLRPEDIPRNRIYAVAGTQGFLLDYFGIDWKGLAQDAGPEFTFFGLLRTHLGVGESGLAELVERAKNKYGYGKILSSTTEAAEGYEQAYARELEIFEAQGGLRFEIVVSSSNLSRSRVSRAKKWLMGDGRSCLCSHFKVYTLRGGDWKLELHDAGLLELNDWDAQRKEVIFYDPGVGSVSLNGEPASPLAPGTRIFESLELTGDHFTFSSKQPGKLVVTGDTVRLLFDSN